MAFTYKNIAAIWNSTLKPNEDGTAPTMLAEDLSNLVDAGTYASNNVGLKNHYRNIIVGIHNHVIVEMLEENKFDILRSREEFAGGLQRIMAQDTFSAQESHILNLVGNVNYHDGKYYGLSANAKVFLQTDTFKVVHSRAEDFEGTMFTNAEDLAGWFGLVAVTERNTITATKNSLEKRLLNKMIVNCFTATTPRVVHLITRFNDMTGANETLATLKADRQKWAYFASYCKEVTARLIDYVKQPNKKYNNGDNLTFCNDASVVMLSEFKNDIEYLAQPIEYNPNGNTIFKTVPWWQSGEDDMLPSYGTTGTIKVGDDTHYDMVVACIYDRQGIGAETILDKVTIESVQEEGFNNYHDHQAIRYYVDDRLTSVVLALD